MYYYFVGVRGNFVRESEILLIYMEQLLVVCLIMPMHFIADEET
jgi:hypothetical protein